MIARHTTSRVHVAVSALAAARARSLSPSQLLARLDDRLRLLTGGPRAGPDRHRTLRATLGWSYDLLSSAQRQLFQRLSAFAGPFDLTADGRDGGGLRGPGHRGCRPPARRASAGGSGCWRRCASSLPSIWPRTATARRSRGGTRGGAAVRSLAPTAYVDVARMVAMEFVYMTAALGRLDAAARVLTYGNPARPSSAGRSETGAEAVLGTIRLTVTEARPDSGLTG